MDFGNQTLTLKVLVVLFDLTPFSARPVFVCFCLFCFFSAQLKLWPLSLFLKHFSGFPNALFLN